MIGHSRRLRLRHLTSTFIHSASVRGPRRGTVRRFWALTARSPIQRDSRGELLCWVGAGVAYSDHPGVVCIFQRLCVDLYIPTFPLKTTCNLETCHCQELFSDSGRWTLTEQELEANQFPYFLTKFLGQKILFSFCPKLTFSWQIIFPKSNCSAFSWLVLFRWSELVMWVEGGRR